MSQCSFLSEVYTRTSLGSRTFPGSTHIAMNQGSLAAQTIVHHNQKYLEKIIIFNQLPSNMIKC